jgi:hypothetical protein
VEPRPARLPAVPSSLPIHFLRLPLQQRPRSELLPNRMPPVRVPLLLRRALLSPPPLDPAGERIAVPERRCRRGYLDREFPSALCPPVYTADLLPRPAYSQTRAFSVARRSSLLRHSHLRSTAKSARRAVTPSPAPSACRNVQSPKQEGRNPTSSTSASKSPRLQGGLARID